MKRKCKKKRRRKKKKGEILFFILNGPFFNNSPVKAYSSLLFSVLIHTEIH